MQAYVEVIKTAFLVFPLIAFLISLPFILWQYHKYGSISFWRALIIYSFVFYLTCAYFLVIMPLPTVNEVAAMTSPRTQLIPFKFVVDFFEHTSLNVMDIRTYLPALSESYFFVPLYNILLTLPFGIYLRYFCKCNLRQVAIGAFLLSLFFELTQLSGLYFIYPRGYRLFDVDDLLLNTIGGIIGYAVAQPLVRVLPDPDKITEVSREKSKIVSGLRRSLAFSLDLVLCLIGGLFLEIILPSEVGGFWPISLAIVIYYFLLPIPLNGSTLVEKFLNLRVVDTNMRTNFWRMWLRRVVFIAMYIILPEVLLRAWGAFALSQNGYVLSTFFVVAGLLLYFGATSIRFLFTAEPMLYEKLSKTRLINTLEPTRSEPGAK